MKTLLAVLYNHFEFLYLDPRYRITDSRTDGAATNDASLRLTGPVTSFWFGNDRGQVFCSVAPTKSDSTSNWFYIPLVRQYLAGSDETTILPVAETAVWIRDNLSRIEALFTDESVDDSCEAMSALREAMADKYFGPEPPCRDLLGPAH